MNGKMTFKDFVCEEWADTYKITGNTVEVFKNPKPSELASDSSRAFLFPNGNLYAWNGNKANHGEMWRAMADKIYAMVEPIPLIWDETGGGKLAIASSIKYLKPSVTHIDGIARLVSKNKNVKDFYGANVKVDSAIFGL
jgi:hypothetical protein